MATQRSFNPLKTLILALAIIAFGVYTYTRDLAGPEHIRIKGRTMGTSYNVKIANSPLTKNQGENVRQAIDQKLDNINDLFSTYREESLITRFNRHSSTGTMQAASEFVDLTREALTMSEQSEGAFDPTIEPLISLWGFNKSGGITNTPSPVDIQRVRSYTGYSNLVVTSDTSLRKQNPKVELNFSAMAKGYAVDQLAELLRGYHVTNMYVEIGGDLYVSGHNPEGEDWNLGVERPVYGSRKGEQLQGVLQLSEGGVATSGDYRNFFKGPSGRIFSHVMDPRSGHPVRVTHASVTVIAPDCTLADALATTLFVMGPKEGFRWLKKQYPEAEAYFLTRGPKNTLTPHFTEGFRARFTPRKEIQTNEKNGSNP